MVFEKLGWDLQMNSSSWKSRCFALTLLLALFGGCRFKWLHLESRVFESKKIGIEIFVALNSYHHKYGQFPSTLQSLVPEFLNVVKNPTYGTQHWQYYLSIGESASLKFQGVFTTFLSRYTYTQGFTFHDLSTAELVADPRLMNWHVEDSE